MLSVLSGSSEPLIPLLQIHPKENVACPKNRSIFVETVGNIGCFPGWSKTRLDLLSPYDTTHRFGIALLDKDAVDENEQNRTWVYLQSPEGPVAANVSSIAKRLGFDGNAKVLELARSVGKNPANTALEEAIQKVIKAYKHDFKTLKAFFSELRDCQNAAGKIEELINASDLNNEINDPEIAALCKMFLDACRKHFAVSDSLLEVKRMFKEFKLSLVEKDSNFASFIRENVLENSALWGNTTPNLLADLKARKIGSASTGGPAVRLKICAGELLNRFAIKTDGYIYYDKPGMTSDYVPCSADGKTWLLLKIKSLHYRTGISVEDIIAAATIDDNGEGLYSLLSSKVSLMNLGSLHAVKAHPDGPFLIPEGSNLAHVFCQITKYLPIESLKALEMINSEYKEDVDYAILREVHSLGYWTMDIDRANQFLKDYRIEMCREIPIFQEKCRDSRTLFDFNEKQPQAFFNFDRFTEDELLSIGRTFLDWAVATPKLSKRFCQERGSEITGMAVKRRNFDILAKLLNYGIRKDTFDLEGNSLLHLAVRRSSMDSIDYRKQYSIMKLLLEKGCDVNVRNRAGNTPMHAAILNSLSGCIAVLIKHNPRMDLKNNAGKTALDLLKEGNISGTPLHDAVLRKNGDVIKWLLKNGVDVNAADAAGNTSLHVAAYNENYLIMQLILQNSEPNKDLRNGLGENVRDIVGGQILNGKCVPYFVREALGIEVPYDIMRVSLDPTVYFSEDETEGEVGVRLNEWLAHISPEVNANTF